MTIAHIRQNDVPGFRFRETTFSYKDGDKKAQKLAWAKARAVALAAGEDPSMRAEIRKFDNKKQIVWAEVYVPGVPDSQGDFMTAPDIEWMAYDFMKAGRLNKIDVMHDNKLYGCQVVESFIAREGDPVFIPGSWVAAVHIPDEDLWMRVEKGDLNGFSMQALSYREPTELELDIPEQIMGVTSFDKDHVHEFFVKYDENGRFLGGETSVDAGHSHKILKGTLTEASDGHAHRFSFVESLLDDRP